MSRTNNLTLKQQQGEVSLQNIFWVVGIIVGLVSILQFVLPYIEKQNGDIDDTEVVTETETDTQTASDTGETIQEQSEPTTTSLMDSPSTKIGNYIAYDNGVAVDETLGIMWMRCSLGQEWNGSNCEGSAEAYSMQEAQQALDQLNKVSYVGLYDWQMPDIESMHSLIYCSDGYEGSYTIPLSSGNQKTVAAGCANSYFEVPTIKNKVFPDTQWAAWRGYWSSSQNDNGEPLTVYFNTGEIKAKNKPQYVRAMRYLNAN